MSDGDFFREVEADLRREQLARIWDRYGVYILAVAALIVIGVAGSSAWQWWRAKEAARIGDEYAKAQALNVAGKDDEAAAALAKLSDGATSGYRLLATLKRAGLAAKAGKTDEAVKLYDEAARLRDPNAILTGFARIQAALLRLDAAPESEIIQRVAQLDQTGGPWRNSANEILGLAAMKAGRQDEAEKRFGSIFADPQAPQAQRERAQQMLGLIVKQPAPKPAASAEPQR